MTPEFSRPQSVDAVPSRGLKVEIAADAAERQALAKRFGLKALDMLEADFVLKPVAGGPLIHVGGGLRAAAVQTCVISLGPVPAAIEEPVDVEFGPATLDPVDVELSLEDDDPPEPIENGQIDLGELAAQILSVSLDPFPRAPDANLAQIPATEMGPGGVGWTVGAPVHPLAGLARLASREDPED